MCMAVLRVKRETTRTGGGCFSYNRASGYWLGCGRDPCIGVTNGSGGGACHSEMLHRRYAEGLRVVQRWGLAPQAHYIGHYGGESVYQRATSVGRRYIGVSHLHSRVDSYK